MNNPLPPTVPRPDADDMPGRMVLVIEPLTGWTVPQSVRLRRLLKTMLRTFGWRCVSYAASGPPGRPDAANRLAGHADGAEGLAGT